METTPPPIRTGRPTILTVAAVICIVFGIIGILGSLPSLVGIHGNDPVTQAMMADTVVQSNLKTLALVNAIAGSVLLAAGIGLLKCREWARKATLGWSIYSIFASIAGTYFTLVHMMPAMQKGMQEQLKTMGESAASTAKIAMMAATGGAFMGLVFSIGLAIALMVMVTRAPVKAACR